MDINQLTKEWIQFLKNNRIAGMRSDPTTGQLKYKRKVTVNDLVQFLQTKTDFSEELIRNSIGRVVSKKGKQQTQQSASTKPRVNYKDTFKEEFQDDAGDELNEKEVEMIFKILLSQVPSSDDPEEKQQPDKSADLEKLKKLVTNTMTQQQRMSLWRALNAT